MGRALLCMWLAACGRLEFDPLVDASTELRACSPWQGSWTAEPPTIFFEMTGYIHGPSLSPDCLTLYYSRGGDIRQMTRGALDQPFGAETLVVELSDNVVNDLFVGLTPPLGLEAFVARLNGNIWRATRASASEAFTVIEQTSLAGLDAIVSSDGLRLYYEATPTQDIYVAERSSIGAPFGSPVPVPELATAQSEHSIYITPNELFAITGRGAAAEIDLWMLARADRSAPFGAPVRLDALSLPVIVEAHTAMCPATCELFYIAEATTDTRIMKSRLVPQ